MFTGIVQTTGSIHALAPRGGDIRLEVAAPGLGLDEARIGDSICVSGVCLTVVELAGERFAADVSTETLACTSLGARRLGDAVNLEKALRLSDRLGGHLVSGHVDGVGRVVSVQPDGRAQRWVFQAPAALARYIAQKGSITIDGVSLTVNAVAHDTFDVALIPHTVAVTTFRERAVGDPVNLEVDLLARYVERLLAARDAGAGSA
jgi:riboflavin synthase